MLAAVGWYDLFARFYDRSLEPLYREPRRLAADALELRPGLRVLDLPCGTGASFPELLAGIGPSGALLGVDASPGMLAQAEAKIREHGWTNAHLLAQEVDSFTPAQLEQALGAPARVDRLHIFLGMSAFPDHTRALEGLWQLLAPGGRCVIVDVHAERLGVQGRVVNLVARAELRRRSWEPLADLAEDFERHPLPSLPEHGGELFLATGTKAG